MCRQLGYSTTGIHHVHIHDSSNLSFTAGAVFRNLAYFGKGNGSIHLDNVQCGGFENSLSFCKHNGIGKHNCQHHEDASVICYDIGKHEMTLWNIMHHFGFLVEPSNNKTVCSTELDNELWEKMR